MSDIVAQFRRDPEAALDALVAAGDLRAVGWELVRDDESESGWDMRTRYVLSHPLRRVEP